MIDTIILRIHNIAEKYRRSIKVFEMDVADRMKKEIGFVKTSEFEAIKKKYNDSTRTINSLKLNRTGQFLVQSATGNKKSHSGNYEFRYSINWDKNYLELNFSIPKFVHGTNLLMYIEHFWDRDYKYSENNSLEYNMQKAPKLLLSFLRHFIKMQFIDPIDLEDVEITRIDVCWNQVFKSWSEALYYLQHQKKIRKKHSREEEGLPIDYGTSLMHATKRYSVKIYHKGSEYRKHDLKQHLKYNEEKGIHYFKTEKLSKFADRILRYEITIRSAELNYLFKHNIFRNTSNMFKLDYKRYLKISATKQRNDSISKKIGTLEGVEQNVYRSLHPYERITKDERDFYKYFSKLMNKYPKFMMKENDFSKRYNSENIVLINSRETLNCDTALFSKEFIALCLEKLALFIKDFQLDKLPEEEKVSTKIDRYNNFNRHKLPKEAMVKFYCLLLSSGSFKEAARLSRFSKATLYRYKYRFKKLGISENHIKPEDGFELPNPKVNLNEYHAFLINEHPLKRKPVIYDIPRIDAV